MKFLKIFYFLFLNSSNNNNNTNNSNNNRVKSNLKQNKLNSIHQEDDEGMSIDELAEYVKQIGVKGIFNEFNSIRQYPTNKTIEAFNKNRSKNRYSNVVCLDESRVRLRSLIEETEASKRNTIGFTTPTQEVDYVHANYVDGYKQKNAYISTQGPLEETIEDFWQMIWQEMVHVIVMTTRVIENRTKKCSQYWPLEQEDTFKMNNFMLHTLSVQQNESFTLTKIQIKNVHTQETRDLMHAQFTAWPDHGCPKSPNEMIEFVDIVRKHQAHLTSKLGTRWSGHLMGPPIVVHCSAGIGRTGTFCTIDIALNRLKDTTTTTTTTNMRTLSIKDILTKVRSQRAQSVQTPDQYMYCYMSVLHYALSNNLLQDTSLNLKKLFSL